MLMENKFMFSNSHKKGQAMAEFALVLPILLLVIIGLLEAGRALFIYNSVTNASRDAVRYASAFGVNGDGELFYQDCEGIRNAARKTGIMLNLADDDITIEYDEGLVLNDPDGTPGSGDEFYAGTSVFDTCDADANGVDTNVWLECGHRVIVTVETWYSPMVNILPWEGRLLESQSARSFYGVVEVGENADVCDNY